METVKLFRMTSDEAPLRWGGGMRYASQALPRRRLLFPVLALGGLLLLMGCAKEGAQKHYNFGNALKKQGKYVEAEKEFREAIRLQPDYAEAHELLAAALLEQGKTDEGIAERREAVRLKPGDANFHINLGDALLKQGDTAETIKEYRWASRLIPDRVSWDAPNHIYLGGQFRNLGKLEEAETEYRKAIRLIPSDNWALENLAALLDKQGRRKEARVYWERALKSEDKPEWIERIKKRLAEPR
jgi:Flp pilus assembly protein TadD